MEDRVMTAAEQTAENIGMAIGSGALFPNGFKEGRTWIETRSNPIYLRMRRHRTKIRARRPMWVAPGEASA